MGIQVQITITQFPSNPQFSIISKPWRSCHCDCCHNFPTLFAKIYMVHQTIPLSLSVLYGAKTTNDFVSHHRVFPALIAGVRQCVTVYLSYIASYTLGRTTNDFSGS